MATYRLRLTEPRPFFAEIPYYLWGQVNYDSYGDCKSPTDRNWTWLELKNRETGESLDITGEANIWEVTGDAAFAARIAHFLVSRCHGEWISPFPSEQWQGWDHETAAAHAAQVQSEFEQPALRPFDVEHWFWGSWKWIGWFATEFTWWGRWIMHSVVRNDRRAVFMCIDWLRGGPAGEQQSQALRYALNRFTGRSFATDREWVEWYDKGGGVQEFPEPDFDAWLAELKTEFGE
jgi:hypothetical protein